MVEPFVDDVQTIVPEIEKNKERARIEKILPVLNSDNWAWEISFNNGDGDRLWRTNFYALRFLHIEKGKAKQVAARPMKNLKSKNIKKAAKEILHTIETKKHVLKIEPDAFVYEKIINHPGLGVYASIPKD